MTSHPKKFSIKTILTILFLFLILVITLPVIVISHLSQPVNQLNSGSVSFTIDKGQSLSSIGQKLEDQRLIKNALIFKLIVLQLGISKNIQAGNFTLSPSMSSYQIARNLTKAASEQTALTIIEGWRREEIVEYIDSQLTSPLYQFNPQVFLELTANFEGLLYPDTYLISPQDSEDKIVAKLLKNFESKTENLSLNSQTKSRQEILILASIIEREARTDRAIISGILWKRLENDWPLQADATLQYAKGFDPTNNTWWPTPLSRDKDLISPYNTYQNPGLPPAPICNPSLSSIKAALNPQASDYWYYITDLEGNMHYATNYDQHLQNIKTYLR